VVIYGALRRWSPQHFRATLQAFFLPADIMICVGHGLAGMWTMEILRLFSLSIPLIGLAIVIGQKLMYRIPHESFERLLYMVSLLVGVLLIL
jgi:hypothetical protein